VGSATVFSVVERERLRDDLPAAAGEDRRVTGAAITGSGAVGRTDEWSDIDLYFRAAEDVTVADVPADWTETMYRRHPVVHHMDVPRGSTVYRVFLPADSLQVDPAIAPAAEFGTLGPAFRPVSGRRFRNGGPHPPRRGS
jgi:hypothetical protein